MGVVTTQVTVRGTDYPWEIGASTPNTDGTALVAYNTHFCDGSATLLATAGQNAAYLYGQLHQHAGETSPTKVAVSPGDKILIQYYSTFVQSQGTSAGDSGPSGSPVTSGTAPLPAGGCVTSCMPSNVIAGVNGYTGTGTVNTSGTTVTFVSGTAFNPNAMLGHYIWINSVKYSITAATSTTLTLGATAGTQTGVTWYFWGAETAIGGLVGAITDSSNNVLTVWDFGSWVGNLSFAISGATETAASVVTMSGTYSGTQQYTQGQPVFITGVTTYTWLNGHTHTVISSTSSQLVIQDSTNHGTQTFASISGNALGGQITLTAPANAAFLTMGINDTQLFDNTGSFVVNVSVTTNSSTSSGDPTAGGIALFKHYPAGVMSCSFMPDQFPGTMSNVFLGCYPVWQMIGSPFNKPLVGQLFPRGAQNTGGNIPGVGQNFTY
jgi:hypothetical protein